MSKLLINESPLQVLPSLAKAIGLNEAIFLQQLHYWISHRNAPQREGRGWHYEPMTKWLDQFPFWSLKTLKRIIKSVSDKKLIIKKQFQAESWNHTNWYSINYEELEKLEVEPKQPVDNPVDKQGTDRVKMTLSRKGQNDPIDSVKMTPSYIDKEINQNRLLKKTKLEGQPSVDNSGSYPREGLPSINKIFKKMKEEPRKMTDQEEQARRKVLEQQLEQLTKKMKVG